MNYYDKTTTDQKLANIDLTDYLKKTGDASNTTVTFTEPTELAQPTTGEKLSGIIGKVSLAIKNIKTLITLIGNTDISSIGDGTVTGAISDVNGKLSLYTYGDKVYGSSSTAISPVSWAAQWISIIVPDGYSFFTAICCSNNDVVCGVSAANYDNDNSRVLVNAYNRHTQARDFSHVYIVPIFIRD